MIAPGALALVCHTSNAFCGTFETTQPRFKIVAHEVVCNSKMRARKICFSPLD